MRVKLEHHSEEIKDDIEYLNRFDIFFVDFFFWYYDIVCLGYLSIVENKCLEKRNLLPDIVYSKKS